MTFEGCFVQNFRRREGKEEEGGEEEGGGERREEGGGGKVNDVTFDLSYRL